MSLFGAIQQASTGLQASQVGLQVVGNNIANSGTPGYIRQRLELTPSIASREGGLILGHGVRTTGVVQTIDKALIERLFQASNAVSAGDTLGRAYNQLEDLVGTLDGGGIPGQLTKFNNAIHDLSTQPADKSLREFVILQGEDLARSIRTTFQSAQSRQLEFNDELKGASTQINRQLQRIADLNVQVSTVEGGGVLGSDASGLREQRYAALDELAKLIDINIQEQPSGAIAVFSGGDYLVSDGNYREVFTAFSEDTGGFEVRIRDTDSALAGKGGVFGAIVQARDEIFGGFLKDLDEIATGLIRAVNEVHSQGQGRTGFTSVAGTNPGETGVPLRSAGLPFAPSNGSFEISVLDKAGAVVSKHNIAVRALNQVGDSTLESVAADIDAIEGLSATVNSEGQLSITSESQLSFVFGQDTSGLISAAGINTFFTGGGAIDIDVNQTLNGSSDFLAVSKTGIGKDTDTLTKLVDIVDRPIASLDNQSVRDIFDAKVAVLGQQVSLQRSITDGADNYYQTLQSQHLAITGVNIDEESIRLITYNRAFQASSRVISVASEMLDILVNL